VIIIIMIIVIIMILCTVDDVNYYQVKCVNLYVSVCIIRHHSIFFENKCWRPIL